MTLLITYKDKTRKQTKIECVAKIEFIEDFIAIIYAKYLSMEMPDYAFDRMIIPINDILRMVMK